MVLGQFRIRLVLQSMKKYFPKVAEIIRIGALNHNHKLYENECNF